MADMTRTTMTAAEFLELPESNQIVQLIHGEVIMSPAPTSDMHQLLVGAIFFLYLLVKLCPARAILYAQQQGSMPTTKARYSNRVYWAITRLMSASCWMRERVQIV
jgi:hypothetical protein